MQTPESNSKREAKTASPIPHGKGKCCFSLLDNPVFSSYEGMWNEGRPSSVGEFTLRTTPPSRYLATWTPHFEKGNEPSPPSVTQLQPSGLSLYVVFLELFGMEEGEQNEATRIRLPPEIWVHIFSYITDFQNSFRFLPSVCWCVVLFFPLT